jgi:hypothetical protein
MSRCHFYLILALALCLAAPAVAQDEIYAIYDEGSYSFTWEQWPIGNYDGSFAASGAILDSLLWGNEQTQSCAGANMSVQDTSLVWCYGARYNADTTVDVGALFVRSTGAIGPGNYPVDINTFLAGFAFFDDITNFTIPDIGGDLIGWLSSLNAAHRMVSSGGTINVAAVSDTEFRGTFSGTMVDVDDILLIVTVSGGNFNLTGEPYIVGLPQSAPAMVADHGVFPNPFNPKTRLSFALAEASDLLVTVHDVSGRRVDTLYEGRGETGRHDFEWLGVDSRGRAAPAGVYIYRIVTNRETARGKMILLP